MTSPRDRYIRQTLFFPAGEDAQERLHSASVLIIGCGALGTQSAEYLARAGVGHLRLVDRDVVEWSNLHRQVAFEESDAEAQRAKAEALAERLRRVNSKIEIEARTVDYNFSNCLELAEDCSLIIDGTDNLPTRFLINDVSLKLSIPWIYCGAIGGDGHVQFFSGRGGPCLRCQLPSLPPPGTLPTCETAGVIGPAAGVAASWQAVLALRYLTTGEEEFVAGRKAMLAPWNVEARVAQMGGDAHCPTCVGKHLSYLEAAAGERVTTLCGRRAVQVLPPAQSGPGFDLSGIAARLDRLGDVRQHRSFLRFRGEGVLLTLFADGRAVFDGLTDRDEARSLYARYVGQ